MAEIIAIGGELHDSSVTLLDSKGRIRFSINEERLTRNKKEGRFPNGAMELVGSPDAQLVIAANTRKQAELEMRSVGLDLDRFTASLARLDFYDTRFPKAARVGHHESHAASAYYTSGYDKALIITMDGGSIFEPWCTTVYVGEGGKLKLVEQDTQCFTDCYFFTTALLGFTPNRHEGKITGLAAHGTPNEKVWELFEEKDGSLDEEIGAWSRLDSMAVSPRLLINQAVLAKYRGWLKGIPKEDIAATVQAYTEEKALAYIALHAGKTAGKSIALAGGLFANVRVNQKVKELGFKEVFVHPGMGDEGLSLGAGLAYAARSGALRPRCLQDVFFGPAFSPDAIKQVLDAYGLQYHEMQLPAEEIARMLADGKVVARFDGRMEYGPRALGNRTILYQTTDPTVNNWLNKHLRRTEFMPFAPATMADYADKMYKDIDGGRYTAEFMTMTFDCTEAMKRMSPAVVHVDGTARPQLVRREANPELYRIVSEYHSLTGIPSLINTSFNNHGEPIVCQPMDAVDSFMRCGLPFLAIGPYLVKAR